MKEEISKNGKLRGINTESNTTFSEGDSVMSEYNGDVWGVGEVIETYVNSADILIQFDHGEEECHQMDIYKV